MPWCEDRTGSRLALLRSSERSTCMAYAFAVPIPPGKTEAVRRLTEKASAPARASTTTCSAGRE